MAAGFKDFIPGFFNPRFCAAFFKQQECRKTAAVEKALKIAIPMAALEQLQTETNLKLRSVDSECKVKMRIM